MNAQQRFIAAGWLLLASLVVGAVGLLAWSHFDSRHVITQQIPTVCAVPATEFNAPNSQPPRPGHGIVMFATSDACAGGGREVVGFRTTPNHIPGLVLVALAGALGLAAVTLLRTDPTRRLEAAA